MSMKELDRLDVLTQIAERRLTRRRAAVALALNERQVRRLYRAFVRDGAAGLVSRRRGHPSARRLPTATRERALALVRERYADFGPILCANTPQAKGRVERANGTLQDRLVKELRLHGLSTPAAAEPFLPIFMEDYNRRFATPARVLYDAHRPLLPSEDLTQIFTLQETRRITAQLTVNYKRGLYVIEDTVANRRLRGATALVCEAADGTVTIHGNGHPLPDRLHHRDHAQLVPEVVVAHERLDAAFAWIAAQQRARDAERLDNPKITLRTKKRIRAAMPPS